MKLHYRGEPFPLDALHTERKAAAWARVDAAVDAARAEDAKCAKHRESVSHGNTGLATIGCVDTKRRAGPPMTGNPAQARELKPHTQEELIP